MARALVSFISVPKIKFYSPTEMTAIMWVVQTRVGRNVCHKTIDKLTLGDVSVFPDVHPSSKKPRVISGSTLEIRVELASSDWLSSKKAYNRLARQIWNDLVGCVPDAYFPYVWVTGGPHTGWCDGPKPPKNKSTKAGSRKTATT